MSDEVLQKISGQLDHLISLTATTAIRGLKQNEAIRVLGDVGLDRKVIARIVGTTPATVSARLSEARSKKR